VRGGRGLDSAATAPQPETGGSGRTLDLLATYERHAR